MKRIPCLFSLLMITVFLSCKNEIKTDDSNQMKEVVAVHDELMPKMGVIGSLITELKTADSIQYKNEIEALKESHDAMMNWMQDFGDAFSFEEIVEGKTLTAEKKKELEKQKQSVNALKEQMNTSIETAKKRLQSH